MAEPVDKTALLKDIQRVATELDKEPTQKEYNQHGQWTVRPAKRIHGTWTEAKKAAGVYQGENPGSVTKQDIIQDLQTVAEKIGEPPSWQQYEEHGTYGQTTVLRRFDGIKEARKAAGLGKGPTRYRKPSKEELLDELRRLDQELDGPVTYNAVDEHGKWSTRPYRKRFESFADAREKAGLGGPEQPEKASKEELIDAIRDLTEKIGDVPSTSDMDREGEFTSVIYYKHFSSWSEAVRKAGYEPREVGAPSGGRNPNYKHGESGYRFYGSNWYEKRGQALERDGQKCVICNIDREEHFEKYGTGINVHHLIPVEDFKEPENANWLDNLLTLCSVHHTKYEDVAIPPKILRNSVG